MRVVRLNAIWIVILSLFTSAMMSSCDSSDDDDDDDDDWTTTSDYDVIEQAVLDAWIEANWPDLVGSRQEDGYYIEVLSEDKDPSYPKTNTTSCWVEYNITSRDLDGNICHTRDEYTAIQQGTFTLYTRYAPMKTYISLLDGDSYEYYYDDDADNYQESALVQAMKASEMTINGVTQPFDLTVGSKIRLWMPSRIIHDGGNGSGGYAGQYSIIISRPMVSEIEITNVVVDAEKNEKEVIDWFVENQEVPSDWEFVKNKYADYIYINHSYTPNTSLKYLSEYNYTQLDEAANFQELEEKINETLIDVFGSGVTVTRDEDDLIDEDLCYIWYITRTLDGFIVDTNIEEVKELIYKTSAGTSEDDGSHMSYSTSATKDSYIMALYYTIPKLEYGQWATMITSSLEAYDIDGVTGTSTTTEIAPYASLIFQFFVEND